MSKHTPGPWMWDCDVIKNDPLERVRYRVVARGKTVTQCYYSSSDESAQHDARLIAAAPDLLEALREYRAAILFAQDKQALMSAIKSADDKARAAIAKAEGEKV